MNKERAKELLEVIEALCDGAEIEVDDGEGKGWVDTKHVLDIGYHRYRIKRKRMRIIGQVDEHKVYGVFIDGVFLGDTADDILVRRGREVIFEEIDDE